MKKTSNSLNNKYSSSNNKLNLKNNFKRRNLNSKTSMLCSAFKHLASKTSRNPSSVKTHSTVKRSHPTSKKPSKNTKHASHVSKKVWVSVGILSLALVITIPTVTYIMLTSKPEDKIENSFAWGYPSPDDLKRSPSDKIFTNDYILENWISLDDSYISKYGKPTIRKSKINEDVGAMTVTAEFPQAVLYRGNKETILTYRFQNFKKKWSQSYDFAWNSIVSLSDTKKMADDSTFTADYAYNNWMEIANDYISKYGKPNVKLTPHHENGTLDVKVDFATGSAVYMNGNKVNSVTHSLSGFKLPTNSFNFNWVEPTTTDKAKPSSDSFFTNDYARRNWIKINQDYLNKYHEPVVTITPESNNEKMDIKVEFNKAAKIYFNGNLITKNTIFNVFDGFLKPYDFNWKEPSSSDKMAAASSFTSDYVLQHWVSIDNAYTTKYGKPKKITLSPDDNKGTLEVEITFDKNAFIYLNGKEISNHVVSNTFSGFNKANLIANWDDINTKDFDIIPSSVKDASDFITITKNTTSFTPVYKIIKADDEIGYLEVEVTAGSSHQTLKTRGFKIDETTYPNIKPHCDINFDRDAGSKYYHINAKYSDQLVIDHTTNLLDPNHDGVDEWKLVIHRHRRSATSSYSDMTLNYVNAANSNIVSSYYVTFTLDCFQGG